MPANTTLTKTPYALLADAANIETAVKPGFQHLEKYAIPRFSSTSARNAAFSIVSPEIGQMCYVVSLGHLGFQVWDGAEWKEFGAYTRTREYTAYSTSHFVTNSTLFDNVPGMSIPVHEGVWRVCLDLHYSTQNNDSTDMGVSWTFPGTTSQMTFGGAYRGVGSSGDVDNSATFGHDTTFERISGDVEIEIGGTTGSDAGFGNTGFATFNGILYVSGSSTDGELQLSVRRRGTAGDVQVWRGTVMTARLIAT